MEMILGGGFSFLGQIEEKEEEFTTLIMYLRCPRKRNIVRSALTPIMTY
mgnify:CR=1 FL=1